MFHRIKKKELKEVLEIISTNSREKLMGMSASELMDGDDLYDKGIVDACNYVAKCFGIQIEEQNEKS